MNLSSCWPTEIWLQLLLHQYQLIVDCCNLFSCNGAVVLHAFWCIIFMVAIMVIMIFKWHWHLDAFNVMIMLILPLRVTLGVCSCVTRTMKFSGSTSLVPEVLCTFRHQLYKEHDITAVSLTPPRSTFDTKVDHCDDFGYKCSVYPVALWALPRLVATIVDTICHLAGEYHCFLRLAAWTTWLSTLKLQGRDWWCSMHTTM